MATKHVSAGSSLSSASRTSAGSTVQIKKAGEQFSAEPLDVSHLRPISEGALHRAGLHDGYDKHGNVRDLRGAVDGAFDLDPATLASTEPHILKLRLEHEHGGIIERRTLADGTVVLALIHGDGDVTTARGATTYEALEALLHKMGGLST